MFRPLSYGGGATHHQVAPVHDRFILSPMHHFIKKKRSKKPRDALNLPAQNAVPSTSTGAPTDQTDIVLERHDWAQLVANILYDISDASPILGPLKATSALLVRGLETTRTMKRNQSAWNSLEESLEEQQHAIDGFVTTLGGFDRNLDMDFRSSLKNYIKAIDDVHAEAIKPHPKSKAGLLKSFKSPDPLRIEESPVDALKSKLDGTYREFFTATSNIITTQIANFAADVREAREEGQRLVEALNQADESEPEPSAGDLIFDATLALLYGVDIPLCQEGTRTSILAGIRSWAEDNSTPEKIFWLKDAAGTGKTTVAATLASEFTINKTLAGRFFFTPNSISGADIGQFCVTVAKDISKHVVSLQETITAALKDTLALQQGFHQQFQRLLVEPLKALKESRTLILIIDALDNCHPNGRELLLESILGSIADLGHVKILLTSRPSHDIVDILSGSPLVRVSDVQLFDIHDTKLADVNLYVKKTLPNLTVEQRKQVVDYSGGLFIVASTICSALRWNRQAADLLSRPIHASKTENMDHLYLNLDALYLQILKHAVFDEIGELAHEMMMSVLQIIIVTFQPVSINTIRKFLPKNVEVAAFVEALGAVLKDGTPDRPIKVIHPTFREFLAEEDRANGFLVNTLSSHAITAVGCLDELDRSLDYDVLGLFQLQDLAVCNSDVRELEKRVTKATTAATRYASSYWAYHVAASLDNPDVWRKAIDFLGTKLLNWIELMSWRDSLGACVQGLSHLRSKAFPIVREQQTSSKRSEATSVREAYQFLLQHQPLIQDSALQTYSAALAFTPKDSQIFEGYRKRYATEIPIVAMTTPIQWPTHDVLTGHLKHLKQVEFSPDGNRLATRANDSTLRLWDTNSGALVGYPFETSERIAHIAFSADSGRMAFATRSCKIYVWNVETGKRLLFFSDTDIGELVQLEFSPTRPIIIAAFTQKYGERKTHNTVRLWNSLDGERMGETMQLGGGAVCFAVSPDGLRIAAVSKHNDYSWKDGVATLWNLESCSKFTEYHMPEVYYIDCVSYSPAGNRFVTWDQNGNLYLRDGFTGDPINCDSKHEGRVINSRFSPNGAYMASYGEELTVFLWDAVTGALRYKLAGHTRHPRYISFSQDGVRLASISLDQSVRVWNVETGASMETLFTGYTGNVSHPALSNDWTKLVTVSIADQINLYDANAGTMRGYETEEGDMNFAIPTVSFSSNGEYMVCGYSDLDDTCALGLWSTVTCDPVGAPMIGHKNGIVCVAFSPNGDLVASVSNDGTIRLWDASNGSAIGDPLAFRDGKHVLFSPNGQSVASSSNESIQAWDTKSRITIWKTQRSTRSCKIAFFPDQNRLLSGNGTKIGSWDLSSGPSTLPVVTSEIDSDFDILAFGPGDIFASFYHTKIRLWRVADTIQTIAELSARPDPGFQLGISSDGHFLAHGSSIWNISSPDSPESLKPPQSNRSTLDWDKFPNSLLTYEDGWISSPSGRLLPIPGHLSGQFHHWFTFGWKVVCWTQEWTPVVIDCSPLMRRSVEQR